MATLFVTSFLPAAPSCCALPTPSSSMPKRGSKNILESNNANHSPALVCKAKANSSFMTYESDRLSKVFSDEKTGIVCYRTESGEIICEGLDEGPHFHPSVEQHQLRVVQGNIHGLGVPFFPNETWYMSVAEYMASVLCDGKYER